MVKIPFGAKLAHTARAYPPQGVKQGFLIILIKNIVFNNIFFSNPDIANQDQEDGLERKVAKKT